MPILSARGIAKAYGAHTLFQDLSLTIRRGERVGLLGANGAGKSSLLRVLAGIEPPDAGVVERRQGARVLFLPQEPALDPKKTPREIVSEGLGAWREAKARYDAVTQALALKGADALVAEQAALALRLEDLGGWERGHLVEEVLHKLQVAEIDRAVEEMSGGEKRRVALAQILVAAPDLAILDEPTNHLDADTIEWLEEYWRASKSALLFVTHDRYVLDALAGRIVELEGGALTAYDGDYDDYLAQKATLLEHAERVESNRLNFLRREQEWLRRGPKARTTKQKARIQRAEAALAVEAPKERGRARFEAEVKGTGKTVLDLEGVSLGLGGRRLIDDFTLRMVGGERIGILGANGAGKTSLLKIVSGERAPDAGRVVRGAQTQVAYFDQARAQLVNEWSIFDNVAGVETGQDGAAGGLVHLGGRALELRTYLQLFLFDAKKQRQKVGSLSGGERARVALAKALKLGANLLLLDEPTNDLDVETLAALEDLLTTWPGCALIVTHDRAFLDRVATSILVFEGEGKVVRYPGNYETYRRLRAEAEGAAPGAVVSKSTAPKPVDKAAPPTGPKPLTYAEKIELEGLFDRVCAAEEEVKALEAEFSDPTLYTRTGGDVRPLQVALEAAKAKAAALAERWEFLESRRDAAK